MLCFDRLSNEKQKEVLNRYIYRLPSCFIEKENDTEYWKGVCRYHVKIFKETLHCFINQKSIIDELKLN